MQIFHASTRPKTPWKNGGGTTRPVASAPGQAREFGWRLSLAEVNTAGAFSCFPGISRLMGILQGQLHLEVEGRPAVTLRPENAAFAFPGDAPAYGAPVDGIVQDINLMFDPECFLATLDYAPHGINRVATIAAHLILALKPLTVNGIELAELDAALVPEHTEVITSSGPLWVASLQRRPLPEA